MMDILEEVKEELKPEVSVIEAVEEFAAEITDEARKQGIKARCTPGGSVAKGTFLKDDYDVDLFLRFDYSYKDDDLSKLAAGILKRWAPEVVHGSRDYFQLEKELNFEIVPVLDIAEPKLAVNVTDMSPLHVDWVKKNLMPGQEDDIRLAKKFCKAQGVYGAESYISGFSGHVIDILIIHHGGFVKLLEASKRWKPKIIIDTCKHYGRRDILFELNKSKTYGPMVLVDPILPSRNAAASLSQEKLDRFISQAKAFLKRPSKDFFRRKEFDPAEHPGKVIVVKGRPAGGKRDVAGSKVVKSYELMRDALSTYGFAIIDSGWDWDGKEDALLWYSIEGDISPVVKVTGPPAEMAEHAKRFRAKYPDATVEERKLVAMAEREHTTAEGFIKSFLPRLKDRFIALEKY